MKKVLSILATMAMGASALAQGTTDGNITFANRFIPIASGASTGGGNGDGTYHVPIRQYNGGAPGTVGAGTLPGGVTVGLFLTSNLGTPLATTLLRSTTSTEFFANSAQTVFVTGNAPGTTPNLTVRAWQGAAGFDAAKNGGQQFGEWAFTPKPLGGTPAGGGTPIPTPNMTGWGPEDGSGLTLTIVPEPSTLALGALGLGALLLRRRK